MKISDPRNITQQDLVWLKLIAQCGFVRIDLNGKGYGYLESSHIVSPGRLERLRLLGFLKSSGDALFGVPSQTWRLTDGTQPEEIRCGPVRR